MEGTVLFGDTLALVYTPAEATRDEAMEMITNARIPQGREGLNEAVTNLLLRSAREVFSHLELLPEIPRVQGRRYDWRIPLDAPCSFSTEEDIVAYFMERLRRETPKQKRRTSRVFMEKVDVVSDDWKDKKPCESRSCVAFVVFWGLNEGSGLEEKDTYPKLINILGRQ